MAKESAAKPFYSVLVLAFACSVLVAGAAVGLRPLQEANRQLDRQKNILYAAGLYEKDTPVKKLFKNIDTRIIELSTGEFIPAEKLSPENYDQLKAALSPDMGHELPKEADTAGIRKLENFSLVYLIKDKGNIDQIILPIRGKGLWSTLYGYISLDADLSTIRGITFYEHGETPGLGGEIENSRWQSGWKGKKMYNDSDEISLHVGKGKGSASENAETYQVDGLSGATITTQGVHNLMMFWFGENGFKPFFEQLKSKGGLNG